MKSLAVLAHHQLLLHYNPPGEKDLFSVDSLIETLHLLIITGYLLFCLNILFTFLNYTDSRAFTVFLHIHGLKPREQLSHT